jgi:uncharacterized protein YqgC (DUF456 family)
MTAMGFVFHFMPELTVFVALFLAAIAFAHYAAAAASRAARVLVVILLTGAGCTDVFMVSSDYAYTTTPHNEWSGMAALVGAAVGAFSTPLLAMIFHLIVNAWGANRQRQGKATPLRR